MPNFNDLGLQAPLRGQNTGLIDVQGPKLPHFKKPLLEMRREGLLGLTPDRWETRSQVTMNGMVHQEAVNGNSINHQYPKAALVEPEKKKGQCQKELQSPAQYYPRDELMNKSAEIQSDLSHSDHSGRPRKTIGRGEYVCKRGSGFAAGPMGQQLMKAKDTRTVTPARALKERNPTDANNNPEGVCCVCREDYCWEDSRIFTECCDIAIGSHCKAQHIEETGQCWNCGKEEVQSEEVSEVVPWVPYDPNDFVKKSPPLPLYVTLFPANDAGRLAAAATVPSASTIIGSNTPSASNSQESPGSHFMQPFFIGLSEEQCAREVARYEPQNAKGSSRDEKAAPQFSPLLVDRKIGNYDTLGGGFDGAMTAPSASQSSLFIGSEPASSDLFQDDQQLERQDAKQYVIDATKHLVEMCNTYGNLIDEADKDEVIDEILKAVGDCETFKAAIEKRILRGASSPATNLASVRDSATVDTLDFDPDEGHTHCRKCEGLELRMKKAADALQGL